MSVARVLYALVAASAFAGLASASMIELTDANQAALGLEVSKSLRVVQEAIGRDLAFDSFEQAKKFVVMCQRLKDSLPKGDDSSALGGFAGQIRELLSEPKVAKVCSLKAKHLEAVEALSKGTNELSYLSKSYLVKLVEARDALAKNEALQLALGRPLELVSQKLGEQLLKNAPEDIKMIAGDKTESKWYQVQGYIFSELCNLSLVTPICQLVRRSPEKEVSAIGDDFADFKRLLESNEEQKIAKYSQKSGVSLEQMSANCKKLERTLSVIKHVDNYVTNGFISRESLESQLQTDPKLSFYYNLEKLCSVQY